MNKRFLVAAAALLMSTTMVTAQEQAAKPAAEAAPAEQQNPKRKPSTNPENGKQYGDWLKECEIFVEAENKEVEICQLVQALVDEKSKQVMLKAAIGYVPNQKEAVMVVSLPLGIFLPPGVQMRVDGQGKVATIPVNTCLPAGCQAGSALDAEFTGRLKKGNKLTMIFANPAGKPVKAELSLKGMTAGLDSFKK
ncbi:invasion associated locus B family protein [Solemya velum gill symbiont]|uniref:invasion associated locus B family protein n=1 Tax=Solemya velum gill symbiont TaxID=2340 RepID=UPI000997EE2D|nr:invasion associated locus B family protein [Solemya velum gill symbiont]OOZ00459.1 hypothetical protein BOW19_00495 [Solemya velum gill symbiont]OOZ02584.1 hypothetical protein BOW20_00495 [Solemya velum gill symbiont]OOZ04956.1 hypothetical protein BOW21_00625 [Solemya velum gill symbiont]OOZ07196.1 hypothetical protein BOW22_00615 [Solemya velum gill symbiont]OOZ09378.1 hypothetical protein BOW23_00615 [Solemya velum gill symbiont]